MNNKIKLALGLSFVAGGIIFVNRDYYFNGLYEETIRQGSTTGSSIVKESVSSKPKEEENTDENIFSRVKNFFSGSEPEITSKQEQIDMLNTDYEKASDEEIIQLFGVTAQDKEDGKLDITVDRDVKSDYLVNVDFIAMDDELNKAEVGGKINLINNNIPKITRKNRKITLSQRRAAKYTPEKLSRKIIKKSHAKATDAEDGKLDVTVSDLDKIDTSKKGEYKIELSAFDSAKQEGKTTVIVKLN